VLVSPLAVVIVRLDRIHVVAYGAELEHKVITVPFD
jgi:hypothetical protein